MQLLRGVFREEWKVPGEFVAASFTFGVPLGLGRYLLHYLTSLSGRYMYLAPGKGRYRTCVNPILEASELGRININILNVDTNSHWHSMTIDSGSYRIQSRVGSGFWREWS